MKNMRTLQNGSHISSSRAVWMRKLQESHATAEKYSRRTCLSASAETGWTGTYMQKKQSRGALLFWLRSGNWKGFRKGNRTRSKGQQRSTRTAFLCLGGRSGAAPCDNRSDRHEGKDDDCIYDLRNPAKSRDTRRTHRNDRDEDRGKKHSVRKYNAGACCAAEAVF